MENTDETSRIARERTNANGKNGQKVTENDVKNEVIYKLIKVLETNGDTINYSLPMTVNSKGKLKFTVSGFRWPDLKKIFMVLPILIIFQETRKRKRRSI